MKVSWTRGGFEGHIVSRTGTFVDLCLLLCREIVSISVWNRSSVQDDSALVVACCAAAICVATVGPP